MAEPAAEAAPARRLPGFLSAFGFPSYRRLWIGAFLSSVGTWTQDVALNWLIHVRFLDPRYLGYRSFASDAPLLAFMLLGGAAADRIDRRTILITSQVLQMSFAATLGVLYATGRLGVVPIIALAFLTGLAQSQSAPTYQAVLTTLVPPAQIQSAVALNSLQFNLSRAIGPVIAGLLLVNLGTGWCFAANALSFLAVIAALWSIAIPSPASGRTQSLRASLLAGLGHVRGHGLLGPLVGLAFVSSFLAYPMITYLPVLAGDVLKSGSAGYSQLLSSYGVGAILGALVTAQRGRVPGRGGVLLRGFAICGVTSTIGVLSHWQPLSAAMFLLSGYQLVCAFSILNSLVQENAPDELRGRVVSIYGVAFRGGMPLGSLVAGFLVRSFGAPPVLASFAIGLTLLAAGLWLRNGRVRAL